MRHHAPARDLDVVVPLAQQLDAAQQHLAVHAGLPGAHQRHVAHLEATARAGDLVVVGRNRQLRVGAVRERAARDAHPPDAEDRVLDRTLRDHRALRARVEERLHHRRGVEAGALLAARVLADVVEVVVRPAALGALLAPRHFHLAVHDPAPRRMLLGKRGIGQQRRRKLQQVGVRPDAVEGVAGGASYLALLLEPRQPAHQRASRRRVGARRRQERPADQCGGGGMERTMACLGVQVDLAGTRALEGAEAAFRLLVRELPRQPLGTRSARARERLRGVRHGAQRGRRGGGCLSLRRCRGGAGFLCRGRRGRRTDTRRLTLRSRRCRRRCATGEHGHAGRRHGSPDAAHELVRRLTHRASRPVRLPAARRSPRTSCRRSRRCAPRARTPCRPPSPSR